MSRLPALVAAGVIVAGAVSVQLVSAGDTNPGHYTVEATDTWQSIAASHRITADQLQVANDVGASTSDSSHPRTGRIIHIPEAPPVPPSTTSPTTTSLPPASTTTSPPVSSTSTPPTSPPSTSPPTSPPATTSPSSTGGFFEDFSSPASLSRFQFQTAFGTQQGAVPTVGGDWLGDHDMSCGAPTTTRTVNGNDPASMVWYCAPGGDPAKGHLMTSEVSVGYGQVSFSPKQVFTDVQRICWDQNMTQMGGRKWTQVAVVAEADYQRNGRVLTYAEQDLMPAPASGFHSVGAGGLLAAVHGPIGFVTTTGPSGPTSGPNAIPVAPPIFHDFGYWENGMMTDDKATRYEQCFSNAPGGIQVERDTPLEHESGLVPGIHIPQGQVRVIFQDDTYDNFKGGLGDRTHGDDPRVTWHWDNLRIDANG